MQHKAITHICIASWLETLLKANKQRLNYWEYMLAQMLQSKSRIKKLSGFA